MCCLLQAQRLEEQRSSQIIEASEPEQRVLQQRFSITHGPRLASPGFWSDLCPMLQAQRPEERRSSQITEPSEPEQRDLLQHFSAPRRPQLVPSLGLNQHLILSHCCRHSGQRNGARRRSRRRASLSSGTCCSASAGCDVHSLRLLSHLDSRQRGSRSRLLTTRASRLCSATTAGATLSTQNSICLLQPARQRLLSSSKGSKGLGNRSRLLTMRASPSCSATTAGVSFLVLSPSMLSHGRDMLAQQAPGRTAAT